MNAKEIVKNKNYASSSGLPEGKTIIDLTTADFNETKFDEGMPTEKLVTQVTLETGEIYNLPKSVMQKVQEAVEKKASAIEVNRSGLTRNDTKYVTYLLDDNGKVIQE